MDCNDFESHLVSTQTVIAYINCSFNPENIFTSIEPVPTTETNLKKIKGKNGQIFQLKYNKEVKGPPAKKKGFRNQVTLFIWVIDKIVSVKISRTGKFHITGSRNTKHQTVACVEVLKHIRAIHTEAKPTFTIVDRVISKKANKIKIEKETESLVDEINITLDIVMENVDFKLGFDIDQKKLDNLLQKKKHEFYTFYEKVNVSINVKLDYEPPTENVYTHIIIHGLRENKNIKITNTIAFDCPLAKVKKIRTHTFIVFGDGGVILSSRYYTTFMMEAYKKFRSFMEEHRDEIELKLLQMKFDPGKLRGIDLMTKARITGKKDY